MAHVSYFSLLPHQSTQQQEQPPHNLHRHHQRNPNLLSSNQNNDVTEQEFDLSPYQFDALPPPNTSSFLPNPNFNNPFSETDSNPDSIQFDGEDTDSDQMNFVTNLFSPREQNPHPNLSPSVLETEFDDNFGLELGFASDPQSGESSHPSVPRGFDSSIWGLRVVGLDSDSDSESEGFVRDDDPYGDPSVPLSWDAARVDELTGGINLDLEWEEVGDQRVLERDRLGSVIERIEELSVSSELSNIERDGIEEGDRDLEWEFLLAVNNLEGNLDFENESLGEYDELFGQLLQNGAGPKGSPPTAKSFVENLPIVILSEEKLREDSVVCAVCKDDISAEDNSVTRLPCAHLYHEDCIVPWLCLRNTCPVCRYELPTDDPDYERRKSHEGAVGFSQDLLVRYALEPIL